MVRKIYKRIGLRRDRNLSDLSNSTAGLNNLLDTLVDDISSTFISEDLSPIRNIFASGLTNSGYRQFVGSAAQTTNQNGINLPFFPRITYQNRLDRFLLFSGAPFKTDNFWEAGNFTYTGKITPESVDVNGGVQWEGYFIPTITGAHTFYVDTTALMTFDFQTEGYTTGIGTYNEISKIGLTSSFTASGTVGTNQITLSVPENTKYIGIGQSVSGVGIVTGTVIADSGYNRFTGVINLTPPTGISSAVSSTITNGNLTFSKAIGQSTGINYSTYVLLENQKYRIRLRYYIPQSVNADRVERNFNVDVFFPDNITTSNLRYNYLYGLDYDFSEKAKGTFNLYYDTSIRFGGGTIGGTANSKDYVKVKSTKKVDIKYQPKASISDVIKATTTVITINGSPIISVPNTSGIEVGNYIFGTGIAEGTVVNQILINNVIIINNNATASGSVTLNFIDHRGFVKRAIGSGSAGSFTLSSGDTTSLKTGMIAIGSGIESYTGITTSSSSTVLSISPSQTIGAGTTVYFYQSRGLINNGLAEFCIPTVTKCMVVTSFVPVDSTSIPVTDSTGVGNGWNVQGSYFGSSTIVNGAPSSTASITLNIPTVRSIPAGANFTVTSTVSDRQLCCPPTDTSPPFNATLEGLETPTPKPNLRIDSGDVKFDSFTAVISSGNITNYSSTDTSQNRLKIQTPSGTFKILCA